MGRKGNTSMNTQTDEPLPNPELEARVQRAALERHNAEQDALCRRAVLMIVLLLSAGVAALVFTL